MGSSHTVSTNVGDFRAYHRHRQGPETAERGALPAVPAPVPPPAAVHAGNSRSPCPARPDRRNSLKNAPPPGGHSSGPALSVSPQLAYSPYQSDPGSDVVRHTPASRHFLQTTLSCLEKGGDTGSSESTATCLCERTQRRDGSHS